MRRIMIAGTRSGSGKTTVVCALLRAFQQRRKNPVSFKCGPDYIDPMFHREIVGADAGNLDSYFMDTDTLNQLIGQAGSRHDIAVLEGVMGYYDGLGMEDTASSYDIARRTDTPVILVMDCRGIGRSLQAQLKGYLDYRNPSGIAGVIFNGLSERLYPEMEEYCQQQGVMPLGIFPRVSEASIESRHLGLVTAAEIERLQEKINLLARMAERHLEMDKIWDMAFSAEEGEYAGGNRRGEGGAHEIRRACADPIRIGIARDQAFCFYYEENLRWLEACGCELVPFSPLTDRHLPDNICGLILGGGYPELYAEELSKNLQLIKEIRERADEGLVIYGECGGFLYLHRELVTPDGGCYPMVGVFDGCCRFTEKLQHFGYVTLTAKQENILCGQGQQIRAHEFHRYVSDVVQDVFSVRKQGEVWGGYAKYKRVLAGFPHIHYYANPDFALQFLSACRRQAD